MPINNKKTISWGWIILWFILFWPLGIFFLFKRINSDKTAILQRSKTVATISRILIGMGIIYLLMSIYDNTSTFISAAIIFGGGGIWVRNISKKMKLKGQKYKKYIALVVNQSLTSIDYIASAVGVSYEIAAKDLQEMIDSGYFVNAYINEGNRAIILAHTVPQSMAQATAAHTRTKVVACKGCGANNSIIIGQINECEYCGSPL